MTFWQTVVQSNTFNFAVLLLIFAVFSNKLNFSEKIEKLKSKIITSINNAKSEQENARERLNDAEKSVKNLSEELRQKHSIAVSKAETMTAKIKQNTEEVIKRLNLNFNSSLYAQEKTLSAKLSDETLKSAIEIAKQKVIKMLEENPDLHNKFIEESIGAL